MFEAEHGEVTERLEDPPPAAGRGVPEAAEALRAPVRQASRAARRRSRASRRWPTATSARYGLLDARRATHEASPSPSRSTPARASPTTPAPGAPCARSTSTACRPATTPARRARTSRAGCSTPRPATTRQAWRVLTQDNPLPAVMGRVCYHPCESACNRGQLDEAVGINAVERFLGDEALKRGWKFDAAGASRPASACWWSAPGPSGLSAAYHLRAPGPRGHDPRGRAAAPAA
ncbi:MAG: hypothetical protein MZW92_42695 [Comamonadaceae bacterium]|nr:hypothetical protein [Comamonadaceae bacterium]